MKNLWTSVDSGIAQMQQGLALLQDARAWLQGDPSARSRWVTRCKGAFDAATRWLASHDTETIGAMLDKLADWLREQSFFAPPPDKPS